MFVQTFNSSEKTTSQVHMNASLMLWVSVWILDVVCFGPNCIRGVDFAFVSLVVLFKFTPTDYKQTRAGKQQSH